MWLPRVPRRGREGARGLGAALAAGMILVSACGGAGRSSVAASHSDEQAGQRAIEHYGCTACHVIPGVQGGSGMVGPPLAGFAQRETIADAVPNTPDNLVHWIQNPPSVKPGTTMPSLDVSDADARAIAAYLSKLN